MGRGTKERRPRRIMLGVAHAENPRAAWRGMRVVVSPAAAGFAVLMAAAVVVRATADF